MKGIFLAASVLALLNTDGAYAACGAGCQAKCQSNPGSQTAATHHRCRCGSKWLQVRHFRRAITLRLGVCE